MQTPVLSGVFWQQLAKSGLLSPERSASIAREVQKRRITSDEEAAELLVRRGLLTQYQADRLLEGRSRGFFFDQYRILDLLGAGGMGWVYRAEDTTTNEVVALKVLLDRHKEDRGMLARFQQEARAGLLLDHPNIVRTRATSSAGGMMYMILDFVEGPSLLEILLRRKRVPWKMACDFARQTALGLHHAHQFGLVHRDVKPQNLLIDKRGHVKLLDFGLAMKREGEGGDEFSMAMIFGHECIGTPAFMAPEQAQDSLKADARSDVYGLGCTLYAALVGDTPFPLKNPHDVVNAHQTQMPRMVNELVSGIPQGVADIVAKMLAKQPEDRYATALEAAEALAPWSRTGPVEFDFQEILAERTQSAMEKAAELHKSRPAGISSTTRLEKLSSVAQSADEMPTFEMGKAPRLNRNAQSKSATVEGKADASVINHMEPENDGTQPAEFRALHHGKVLVPLGGAEMIPLTRDRIVIGRTDKCDLQIPDASVSSKHCELQFDGTWWWITDSKSRNGTRVNGSTVTRRQVVNGDVLSIGNAVRLRFDDAANCRNPEPAQTARSWSPLQIGMVALVLVIALIVLSVLQLP
jgi:eukaryotic-like serine/threonine-protein kinase